MSYERITSEEGSLNATISHRKKLIGLPKSSGISVDTETNLFCSLVRHGVHNFPPAKMSIIKDISLRSRTAFMWFGPKDS